MANWDKVVDLIAITSGYDDDGFPTEQEVLREGIFANELSVRSNEYWAAQSAGVELALMLEMHTIDYEGEEKLILDNATYQVERTYKKGEIIELVCRVKDDDHGV